jgi:hypothetical protein
MTDREILRSWERAYRGVISWETHWENTRDVPLDQYDRVLGFSNILLIVQYVLVMVLVVVLEIFGFFDLIPLWVFRFSIVMFFGWLALEIRRNRRSRERWRSAQAKRERQLLS